MERPRKCKVSVLDLLVPRGSLPSRVYAEVTAEGSVTIVIELLPTDETAVPRPVREHIGHVNRAGRFWQGRSGRLWSNPQAAGNDLLEWMIHRSPRLRRVQIG